MNLVLDTNAYSDFFRNVPRGVQVVNRATAVHLPVIAVAELQYGFALGQRTTENNRQLIEFLASPRVSILAPDFGTAEHYARVAAYLHRQGGLIPQNDMWIAALVLQHGYMLCTSDKHFERLPQIPRC